MKLKRIISSMCFLTLLISLSSSSFAEENSDAAKVNAFSDISGHWAEESINKWTDKGVISGYDDGTFKPDNPVTRAELAKIITLAFDLQGDYEVGYEDVDENAWYYPYLKRSIKYIPTYPLSDGHYANNPFRENSDHGSRGFLPNTNELRAHIAETLSEIKKERKNISLEVPKIFDAQEELYDTFGDQEFFTIYVIHPPIVPTNIERMFINCWLAWKLDIISGDEDGYFNPYDWVTRAELLSMLDKVL